MKKYEVSVPFCGYLVMTISAESYDEAIDKAMMADVHMELDSPDDVGPEVGGWDMHRSIVKGNVFYGPMNEPEATEIEDDEE